MVHEHDSCELVVKIQCELSCVERLILIFILLIAQILCSVIKKIIHIHQEVCQEPSDLVKHQGDCYNPLEIITISWHKLLNLTLKNIPL